MALRHNIMVLAATAGIGGELAQPALGQAPATSDPVVREYVPAGGLAPGDNPAVDEGFDASNVDRLDDGYREYKETSGNTGAQDTCRAIGGAGFRSASVLNADGSVTTTYICQAFGLASAAPGSTVSTPAPAPDTAPATAMAPGAAMNPFAADAAARAEVFAPENGITLRAQHTAKGKLVLSRFNIGDVSDQDAVGTRTVKIFERRYSKDGQHFVRVSPNFTINGNGTPNMHKAVLPTEKPRRHGDYRIMEVIHWDDEANNQFDATQTRAVRLKGFK